MKLKQRFSLLLDGYPLLARALRSPLVALLSIVIAVWALYQFVGVFQGAYDLGKEFSVAEAKRIMLEKRNQELTQLLQKFENPEFLEREAKDRLNLKRPGEEVAVIVPEAQSTSTPATHQNFWFWLRSFFLR